MEIPSLNFTGNPVYSFNSRSKRNGKMLIDHSLFTFEFRLKLTSRFKTEIVLSHVFHIQNGFIDP